MSEEISVSAQGYSWSSDHWATTGTAYIGQNKYMTGFSFAPSKPLRQVSITVNVDVANSNVKWSMTKPNSGPGSAGTVRALSAGNNTITASGAFVPGTTYTMWIWGTGGAWNSLVRSCSGSGELGGMGHVDSGSAFGDYIPYIDNGSSWDQLIPYEDRGSGWEVFG